MRNPKVIILVVCYADKSEYDELAKAIKETWGRTETGDCKIWYVWGRGRNKQDYNDFIIDVKEDFGSLLKKTLAFFEFIKNEDFDYIFRTNTGSYVDTIRIVEHLKDKPRTNFYSGVPGYVDGIRFASGSGFFLSRDLVLLSESKRKDFGDDHIDDVSFGRFMARHGVKIDESCIRFTWTINGNIRQIGEPIIAEEKFPHDKIYHWRLRTDDGQRFWDCEKMYQLYNELNNAKNR